METQENVSGQVIDHRWRPVASHSAAAVMALITGMILGHGSGVPAAQDADHGLVLVTSTAIDRGDDFWAGLLEPRVWRMPHLVMVDHAHGEKTPCGPADATTGPYYCPPNERIYLDVDFLKAIPGELARAYVTAHELGHHVQKLRNELKGREVIDIELGADCYAGMWMHSEERAGRLASGDIEAALAEAEAVGDDRLCPTCGQDMWKHGSSAQRAAAVREGYTGGGCDHYRNMSWLNAVPPPPEPMPTRSEIR